MGHIFFLPIFVILLFGLISICVSENVKKSIDDNRDDNGESNDDSKDESLDIPVENEGQNNITCSRRQSTSKVHEITAAQDKQFPFMAALMSDRNEYLCSGSVISNGLILTSAKCSQLPISHALLNTTKDKKDDTVALLHVIKTDKFPTYTGTDSMKDVGLVYIEKHNNSIACKIQLSNFTTTREVTEIEAIGFGLNAETGQPKELQYIGMEVRWITEDGDILKAYFDCVDTKVLTCFKDTGGPVLYDNEMVGIVVHGNYDCTKEMFSTYAINKKMADILPMYTFKAWLDEKIKKNEEQEGNPLFTYPLRPRAILRHRTVADYRSRNNAVSFYKIHVFVTISLILSIF